MSGVANKVNKPPFYIPTMAEIEAIKWNGFNVVSTFSGCGGSCLGYRMAGYRVLYANEFIKAAQETYKANHPNSILDSSDVRNIRPEEILERINLKKGELDLFDGSPPCASFSISGKREKGWGVEKKYSDTKQRVDDLFYEYARLLKGLQPKVFVAENVAGLVIGTAKGYFKRILQELKDCGYDVKCKIIDAQWAGIPQMRKRTIFVGVRKDLNMAPVHPKPLPYFYTVGDALANVEKTNNYKGVIKGTETYRLWENTKVGESFWKAAVKLTGKNKFYSHVKQSPFRVANTVVQGSTDKYHWSEPRTFTIEELKAISTFPVDFKLTGTFSQQWERVGRAVPPMMMAKVAETVAKEILEKI